MAGKPKSMTKIKQLIILHRQGKGKKPIAKALCMSKNTVKDYLAKLDMLQNPSHGKGWSFDDLINLADPELEAIFHPGNPAYKESERYEDFKTRLPYLLKELKKTGVTRQLLWQEYCRENPKGYSYTQFCYHLKQQQKASKPSMVMLHQPADKLYIDFAGKKLSYTDKNTGEVIYCEVFVACLPFSDYAFVMAVHSQTIVDFLYALACCLQELGGVPLSLVPDNLKAAVTKASRYEPTINHAMEDFANHYGTTVIPARSGKPKDKALVENQVRLIYNRVYAKLRNQMFFDLTSLNQAIAEQVKDHNQTRMQEKPYSREERFLAKEKGQLNTLPFKKYELKYYKVLTVAPNNHIELRENAIKHYYSVPFHLIGQKVKVIYTRSMVNIYHQGRQVAAHVRSFAANQYTTVEDHLCSYHKHYKARSPQYYIKRARTISKTFHRFIELIFSQNKHPEQLYKTCDGLFNLARNSGAERFDKACQTAIDYQHYTYGFIKNMLENTLTEHESTQWCEKHLPSHDNIRGKAYYQSKLPFDEPNQE